MYISRAGTREEESMMIAMMDYNICLMKVVVEDLHPSIEIKRKPIFLEEQVKISQVFHCDGLLLCILNDKTDVVVLNPYRGETRWIKPKYFHLPNGWDMFSYALGYENKKTCRSVKFLRFIDYFYDTPEEQFFWYEIYNFDSDSWTTLDVNPHWCISYYELGITLKGNTYWPAGERKSKDRFVDHLICFDFARERFGPLLLLPLPLGVRDHGYAYVTLSCVKEEKLAALFQHEETNPYALEVWITTKIDVEMVSWSKFLRMYTGPNIRARISTICEGYFIDEEKKVAMGFNDDYPKTFSIIGEAGYFRNLDIGVFVNENCQPHVCSYVPSLVQIKKPTRGKRKRQSSLEKPV